MTTSDTDMHEASKKAVIYASLEKLLGNPIFSTSPRQQRFLKYLVDQTLNGNSAHLRGHNIGVDVFDRGTNFDSSLDSIVRVEAGRLRSKLREYYEKEGLEDHVKFDFPKGTYTIEFAFRNQLDSPSNIPSTEGTELPGIKQFATGNTPSLAVLPFSNISEEASNYYLADGITDSLIFELSNITGLILISRQSSYAYRDKPLRGDEIGLQLGVRYLLEGSVQKIKSRLRISVQLSDSLTARCIWTERYDRHLDDFFDLQDEITRNVVNMLHIKLTPVEKDTLGHEGTVSQEACHLLMCGLEEHWKYTQSSIESAIEKFSLALDHDPNYSAAHAWLSRALVFQWIMCWKNDDDILERAHAHAQTATKLNKYLPYAYSALGWVQLWRKNGLEAVAACRKAVSLDSNNGDGLMFLSMIYSSLGLGKEGLHYIEMGIQLSSNPSSLHLYALGKAHYVLGNYDQAETAWRQGCEVSTNFMPNHYHLCLLYALRGRDEDLLKKTDEIFSRTNQKKTSIRSPWIDERLAATHRELMIKSGLAD